MGTLWAGTLTFVTFAAIAIASFLIYFNLAGKSSNWSLSDALSEEVETGSTVRAAVTKTVELKASSSRLIALFGLIAIMLLYTGTGLAVLYGFALDGKVPPDTEKVATFFLSGAILFAPYVVNKFSTIFQWLKK